MAVSRKLSTLCTGFLLRTWNIANFATIWGNLETLRSAKQCYVTFKVPLCLELHPGQTWCIEQHLMTQNRVGLPGCWPVVLSQRQACSLHFMFQHHQMKLCWRSAINTAEGYDTKATDWILSAGKLFSWWILASSTFTGWLGVPRKKERMVWITSPHKS